MGYRLLAEHGAQDRAEAGLYFQSNIGNYSAELSATHDRASSSAWRLGTSGGIAALGGEGFLSRRLTESFGVVEVEGYPNVRVSSEHRPIGKTGPGGKLLISHLRPYDTNRLGIEQADLPIDAKITVFDLEVSPFYRSGVVAKFPVSHARAARIRLILEDGSALPPGSKVRVNSEPEEFPVGFHGEAFVTNLREENELHAFWNEHRCTLKMTFPDPPPPVLGPWICKEVHE